MLAHGVGQDFYLIVINMGVLQADLARFGHHIFSHTLGVNYEKNT
jgi:hypothetical protein